MNRVLISGRMKAKPEVRYTPKGEKILLFAMDIKEENFGVDVFYVDEGGHRDYTALAGRDCMIYGSLVGAEGKVPLKVKANKIVWMEE